MQTVENKSGWLAVGRAVLVKPFEAEKLSSIIEIPESLRSRATMLEQRCQVIDIGPSCWHNEPRPRASVGDVVIVSKFAGYQLVGDDNGLYRMINDNDIFAKREADHE